MSFLSNENKGLLWELVNDTGIFDKLVNIASRDKILEIFEELLLKINNNNLSIKDKNKMFLSEYISSLHKLEPMEMNIETKEQMKKQREHLFEERLRLKQEEFRKYQPQRPQPINFLEKEQDVRFEPQKDYVDLSNMTYQNQLNMNEVKEVKKKVSFQDLIKPLKEIKVEEIQEKNELKELKEELHEIKELLVKIMTKLNI